MRSASRWLARGGIAVLLLCSLARSAFADGALGAWEAIGQMMIAGFIGLCIVALIVVVKIVKWWRQPPRTEWPPDEPVPPVRVVKHDDPQR